MLQVEWKPWGGGMLEPEYIARSRVVITSRGMLESAFLWQWYLGDCVTRQSLDIPMFQVPRPLSPHTSHTDRYTIAKLQRFTTPTIDLSAFLRLERDYSIYQRQHLAGPFRVLTYKAAETQTLMTGVER